MDELRLPVGDDGDADPALAGATGARLPGAARGRRGRREVRLAHGLVLAARGEGVHHIGYGVVDVAASLEQLRADGIRLVDERPRHGSLGASIAFLHPKSIGGVLTELVQALPG